MFKTCQHIETSGVAGFEDKTCRIVIGNIEVGLTGNPSLLCIDNIHQFWNITGFSYTEPMYMSVY